MQQQQQGLEAQIGKYLYQKDSEKTFIDKIVAKEDVQIVRALMAKDYLERKDLLTILYMLGANETKLLNLGEWERYVLGKYLAWIRDFCILSENLFDLENDLDNVRMSEAGRKKNKAMIRDVQKMLQHNIKFSIDIFFYLGRSTLSLGGSAFKELTTNKFEYQYTGHSPFPQPGQEQKKSFFNISMRK